MYYPSILRSFIQVKRQVYGSRHSMSATASHFRAESRSTFWWCRLLTGDKNSRDGGETRLWPPSQRLSQNLVVHSNTNREKKEDGEGNENKWETEWMDSSFTSQQLWLWIMTLSPSLVPFLLFPSLPPAFHSLHEESERLSVRTNSSVCSSSHRRMEKGPAKENENVQRVERT